MKDFNAWLKALVFGENQKVKFPFGESKRQSGQPSKSGGQLNAITNPNQLFPSGEMFISSMREVITQRRLDLFNLFLQSPNFNSNAIACVTNGTDCSIIEELFIAIRDKGNNAHIAMYVAMVKNLLNHPTVNPITVENYDCVFFNAFLLGDVSLFRILLAHPNNDFPPPDLYFNLQKCLEPLNKMAARIESEAKENQGNQYHQSQVMIDIESARIFIARTYVCLENGSQQEAAHCIAIANNYDKATVDLHIAQLFLYNRIEKLVQLFKMPAVRQSHGFFTLMVMAKCHEFAYGLKRDPILAEGLYLLAADDENQPQEVRSFALECARNCFIQTAAMETHVTPKEAKDDLIRKLREELKPYLTPSCFSCWTSFWSNTYINDAVEIMNLLPNSNPNERDEAKLVDNQVKHSFDPGTLRNTLVKQYALLILKGSDRAIIDYLSQAIMSLPPIMEETVNTSQAEQLGLENGVIARVSR